MLIILMKLCIFVDKFKIVYIQNFIIKKVLTSMIYGDIVILVLNKYEKGQKNFFKKVVDKAQQT